MADSEIRPSGANTISLTGRVAVVTGGAQGLGLAISERLARSGARVALWDIDGARLDAVDDDIAAHREQVDVTDWSAVVDATARTVAALGRIDILVANAGIAGTVGATDSYDIAEWHRIIDLNLTGVFYCARAIVPGMRAQNYGRIVNVSSIAGKEGNPGAAAYSASKAGVIAFTKSLGKELAELDIAVNCVTPAAARTAILEQVGAAHVAYMLAKIPRSRFLELDEAAAMVAWLVSGENSYTTGATFDLSGGRATY